MGILEFVSFQKRQDTTFHGLSTPGAGAVSLLALTGHARAGIGCGPTIAKPSRAAFARLRALGATTLPLAACPMGGFGASFSGCPGRSRTCCFTISPFRSRICEATGVFVYCSNPGCHYNAELDVSGFPDDVTFEDALHRVQSPGRRRQPVVALWLTGRANSTNRFPVERSSTRYPAGCRELYPEAS
jgi:hypothetical protein